MNRRFFIKQAGLAALGFAGLRSYSLFAAERTTLTPTIVGYGALQPDPARILDLPEGFSYRVIAKKGRIMTDGLRLPSRPDGMATFPGKDGRVILVMNHEIDISAKDDDGAFDRDHRLLTPQIQDQLYDAGVKNPMLGGTTTHIYNPATGQIEAEYLSLGGTERNCAGGSTPWGTWITCEETDNILTGGAWTQDHGYNFEVQATEKVELQKAIPLKAMGRFRHEAVAVDPVTSHVYQTEDIPDGAIYRFIPRTPGRLVDGGLLQALAIKGISKCDTRNWLNPRARQFSREPRGCGMAMVRFILPAPTAATSKKVKSFDIVHRERREMTGARWSYSWKARMRVSSPMPIISRFPTMEM